MGFVSGLLKRRLLSFSSRDAGIEDLMTAGSDLNALAKALGKRVKRDESLANYTAMRVGGPADLLIVCESVDRVVETVALARKHKVNWLLLGGGCNVLVADKGVRGLVIINRATSIAFDGDTARAEAGALLAQLARQAVERGLGGVEWAAGLPGAVGGAVVGNAGAFEGDVASVLRSATVLEPDGEVVERPNEWFEFDYRLSRIKREEPGQRPVVLQATFDLQESDPAALRARADEILEWRRTRHPSGATMGSTFKNPPDSHAGYLIEQAGLRGSFIGGAQISEMHGNFFMNTGDATAAEVLALIEHARAEVKRQFGVELELEIELVGEW
ncbi:MAG: UDP-N-acetylmuramate dehydrogenase [Anaerolineae bacterium]|nr:UDP-N-acetylmuramate dehydrogenase [Anaerolineae bacterium]